MPTIQYSVHLRLNTWVTSSQGTVLNHSQTWYRRCLHWHRPEMSKNSAGFWGWFSIIETSGQDAATFGECGQTKVSKAKGTKNGTLGHWRTKPVSLQLKDEVTSYHGRAFPIPKVHKDVLMKEIQRLCDLGVLEWQPSSEC